MRNAWLPAGPEDEKALLLPAVSHPERVGRDTRLVAIALPSVTGGLVRASPVAPRDAFMALVWQSCDVRRFPLEARDFRLLVALSAQSLVTVSRWGPILWLSPKALIGSSTVARHDGPSHHGRDSLPQRRTLS